MFKLKIETSLGAVLDFSESNAYTLIDVTGLDPPAAALNFSRFSSGNGSHRVSGYVEKRNIILTAVINNPLEKNRTALNSYFVLDSKVKIYYISDTMNVFTEGYVESCFYNSFELGQKAVISILCENPYWRDTGETGILFSALESRFEFPFSIPDGGVAISEITSGGAVQIDPGTAETGVIIRIEIIGGTVTGLRVINKTTNSYFGLVNTFADGDVINICTIKGSKQVILTRNGENRNILNLLERNSSWIQLIPGANIIDYDSGTGKNYARVQLFYQKLHQGV